MATPAPTCVAALREATVLWPSRSRASDGIMGDASHLLSRSDHNLGNAFDLTHDPAHGCDAHRLVEQLKQRGDPRVKYIISNGRIWNPSISPDWRAYWGINRHTRHAHVSIHVWARDDTRSWWTPAVEELPPTPTTEELEDMSKIAHLVYNNRVHLFVTGDDLACWHVWEGDDYQWLSESLGGECPEGVVARLKGTGIGLWCKGSDNALYYQWYDATEGIWSGWHNLGRQLA